MGKHTATKTLVGNEISDVAKEMKVIKSASGMEFEELFLHAVERKAFVTYKAAASTMPGVKFKDLIARCEQQKVDHLLVNVSGKYGSAAADRREEFATRLAILGYDVVPRVQAPKRNGKSTRSKLNALASEIASQVREIPGLADKVIQSLS